MSELVNFNVSAQILDAQTKAEPSRTLWKGTVAIRKEGKTYLKPSLFEKTNNGQKAYKLRLENAVLFNQFKTTVNYIQGQIFRKPLMLTYDENLEQETIDFFEDFKEDVDNKNNDWNVFLKTSLKNGLIDGTSYVIVDMPQFDKTEKGQLIIGENVYPNTIKTLKDFNLRPYWVQIELKDVISVKTDWINGKKEYIEFIYKQTANVDDNTIKSKIYRYTRDLIQIYSQDNTGKVGLEKEIANKNGFIPVSLFMCGEPTSDYTALPTLTDLAELNIAHYNAYSEHQSLMRYDRNPLWLATGVSALDENGNKVELVMGPGAGISAGSEADLKSVGVDSQSVIQSMNDLDKLEKEMDKYTASMTTSQNMTAEQVDLISGSADCQIKGWATNFKDFIEDLLCNTAIVAGLNKKGNEYPRVIVNNEFRKPFDYQQATLLQDMVAQGQLSLKTYLSILKSMSIFDDDFNVDEELEELGQVSSNNSKEPPEE